MNVASQLLEKARVVIVGGGIIGCSVAYHLAKQGWTDIVLLERKKLTSGTTWHAAGLIAQLRSSQAATRLSKYSNDLYVELEAETGVATGLRHNGSVSVALTAARQEELLRTASMARAFGIEVEELSPDGVLEKYPHINLDNVQGGVWLPGDGQGDPANIALALAKGARLKGAKIVEGVRVTGMTSDHRTVRSVEWAAGDQTGSITCDHVVNCGGMWAHEVGQMAGVNVPLHACEHFYIVTESIPDLARLPVLRVPDECAYYKEDAGKILLGAFEPRAKPWGMDGIPDTFEFDQLPEDFDHFEPILAQAIDRVPMLAQAGIHTFFNGPESFTPDDSYHLGPSPEVPNLWVAAGFNSIGIQSAGGAGMALARWMDDGEMPFDLVDVDIARNQTFQRNRRYLKERATESLGLLYADHWPFRQKETARGVRRSPFHAQLADLGAVFGEFAGWERANWFAFPGEPRGYDYSWGPQNWFANAAHEHALIREKCGFYDMSSFGKIKIDGLHAETFLNRVCGGDMSVDVGRIVYTQMLNSRGGVEADVTVTRLSEFSYLMVTPAATLVRDMAWLRRHEDPSDAVFITDMTAAEAVLAVMGPESRKVLQAISPADFSNAAFPFGTAREIDIGLGIARAHRVSYVGELGWEIYIPSDMAAHVLETLIDAETGARPVGLHTMDNCRIERAFRHMGHDITPADHVVEAGLGFAVKTGKPFDFIGKQAVLHKRETGLSRRMLQFRLTDPDAMLYHNEPIVRDGKIVGHIASGAYGHTLGGAMGLGYVPCAGQSVEDSLSARYEIEVAGRRIAAEASFRPMYDPKGERLRM
ncbi:GcvT family protein [Jannaschia donghaensis]|uniref:Aminomethyltransferase n=1 Tax=Jannaschia donghaensis TaxID=420998 RepID=A0A0M6YLF0_9RHOB|nr:FAD-dependent oxidoreductase [Jannaschia donghaensis]CTQ51188.1 Aminomethyltransferase [Jannaschia donghaensis]